MKKTISTGDTLIEKLTPGREYTIQVTGHSSTTVEIQVPKSGGGWQSVPGSESSADWMDVIVSPHDQLNVNYLVGSGDVEVELTILPLQ